MIFILFLHVHAPLFLGTSPNEHKFKDKIMKTSQTTMAQHSVKQGALLCVASCATTQVTCSWSMSSFTSTEAWARGVPREAGVVLLWGSLDWEGSISEVVAAKVGRVRLPSLPFIQEFFPIQVCGDKGQRSQLSAGCWVRWDLGEITYILCASVSSFIRSTK